MSGIRPMGALGIITGLTIANLIIGELNNRQQSKNIEKLEQKIETVDSTLKSWDAAMQPMVAEANAKKTLVIKNFKDSIENAAKQHQLDSLENVVRKMRMTVR